MKPTARRRGIASELLDAQYVRMGLRTATYTLEFDDFFAKDALRQLALTMKPGVLYLDGGWQALVDEGYGARDIRVKLPLTSGDTPRSTSTLRWS